MCAIVDANVRDEVFSQESQSDAGRFFYQWLMGEGGGALVAGGLLLEELSRSIKFQRVFSNRLLAGRARHIEKDVIETEVRDLRRLQDCSSDDEHVLALARVSGARLLYTNDRALQRDFRNQRLINDPRGRVYTTLRQRGVTKTHRDLLQRRDLCQGLGSGQ